MRCGRSARFRYARLQTSGLVSGAELLSIMDRALVRGIRGVRRVVVAVVGITILLVGVALLVLPGPAFIVIPIGLAVLALEFEWARRALRRARDLWNPPKQGRS